MNRRKLFNQLSRFYKSNLGIRLQREAEEILSILLHDNNKQYKKILIIGYYQNYLSLFKNDALYQIHQIKKDSTIKFDSVFLFHHMEFEENIDYLLSQLNKITSINSEIIILSSKMHSTIKS